MSGDQAGHGDLAKWLRGHREARGWSRPRTARLIIDAAHVQGDTQVPGLHAMCHNIYRWERGGSMSERYRLLYGQVFGIPHDQFGRAELPGAEVPAYLSPDNHGKAITAIVIVWADGSSTTVRCQ